MGFFLWLKLHCSGEPGPAGGQQSTLCHARAAGSGLTRCPCGRQHCPATCERRWQKACPAESPVCSLCLPFSTAQHFQLQKQAALWHQVDEALCLFPIFLLPIHLLSRAQRGIYLSIGQLWVRFSCSCLALSYFRLTCLLFWDFQSSSVFSLFILSSPCLCHYAEGRDDPEGRQLFVMCLLLVFAQSSIFLVFALFSNLWTATLEWVKRLLKPARGPCVSWPFLLHRKLIWSLH